MLDFSKPCSRTAAVYLPSEYVVVMVDIVRLPLLLREYEVLFACWLPAMGGGWCRLGGGSAAVERIAGQPSGERLGRRGGSFRAVRRREDVAGDVWVVRTRSGARAVAGPGRGAVEESGPRADCPCPF